MELNLTGKENLTDDDVAIVNKLVEKNAKRSNFIQSMDMRITAHRITGARHKYSVHTKVLTDYGFFKSEADDWKLNLAVKEALRKLDAHMHNELKRKKGD